MALHYVFNTPADRIIWDVGTSPIRTRSSRAAATASARCGRRAGFPLHQAGRERYDPFGAAHSSTSIWPRLGMAVARDLSGGRNNVIAVIGDGAFRRAWP